MADAATPSPSERRVKRVLREVLDELIEHVRNLSNQRGELTPEEIDHAQQRLQWLADEVWHLALEGEEE
jgi:hypothetical protein